MSDNRKYYYLKLKESYFDDDAIVLLESMQDGMRKYMPPQKRLAAMISLLGWKKDMIPLPVMPASGYLAEKSNELLLREQS